MKPALRLAGALLLSCFGLSAPSMATEYPLPADDSRLIGENVLTTISDNKQPLESVAARYSTGLLGLLEANPGVDPWLPAAGTQITVPLQMLLPDAPRKGIVVNLAELRLYYYPPGENRVVVYPIGIGQLGAATPDMVTRISQKIPNPTWTPTPNIRKRYAKEGVTLPVTVPAGPDNPMGLFALRLAYGKGHYLIHGTNADFGIGMRVSSGCIRLRPADIEALFNSVPAGTRVQIVNQPVKYAIEPDGKRYIEVHQPLSRSEKDDPQTQPLVRSTALKAFSRSAKSDSALIEEAMTRRSGMPVLVSSGEPVAVETAEQVAAEPQG
ncbi:L,D-transpeptidase family protein [Pantoea sp. PSNIH1]|uniref:L,D-transpeptidase family protein n=1 Tax=Pantoea sp. PSNIH1 TaxID=1484158 RepID=UPI0011A87484|nr:L,D-transpeptidase family protein [Pantoea sp. PSNIH1]